MSTGRPGKWIAEFSGYGSFTAMWAIATGVVVIVRDIAVKIGVVDMMARWHNW